MKDAKLIVMLIDDNRIDLFVHQMHINQMNIACQIIEFMQVDASIKFLSEIEENKWPDLILLDIHMPELNGFDFLERFANFPEKLRAKCKIIVVSSSLDEGDKSRANNHPLVMRLFEKPLNTERLRDFLSTNHLI